jgi:predicted ArsR family transcriptional regulator
MAETNQVVAHIKQNGPATVTEISKALGWKVDSMTAELKKLRSRGLLAIVDTRGVGGRKANVWGLADPDEDYEPPRPDPQSIVDHAIANQPELARVWA